MAHKLTPLLIAAILTTSLVAASGLQIAGVYYDPVQAENGGEAIMLENNGNEPASMSTLMTKQSSIPLALTLLPGQGYLIADTGWATLKDNASWPDADKELGLSLANTEGFVEILNDNVSLDKLVWNASSKAREGYLFTHAGEASPFFRNGNTTMTDIPATIIVLNGPPRIVSLSITDDSTSSGVQLLSYSRNITVSAVIASQVNDSVVVTVTFLDKQYEMEQNESTFIANIPLEAVAPGAYILSISASDGSLSSTKDEIITVLSSTSVSVTGSLVFRGIAGSSQVANFTVKNEGNTLKRISLSQLPTEITCDTTNTNLAAGEEHNVTCIALIPEATPGTYSYVLKLLAS